MTFKIDPEFETLIPPLSKEEAEGLEALIVAAGRATQPLTLWRAPDGTKTLLDGHNRYRICKKHKLPYKFNYVDLPDRNAAKEWMRLNQRSRRNMTQDQKLMQDLRAGVEPTLLSYTDLAIKKAKAVFSSRPDLADLVYRGELKIFAAFSRMQYEAGEVSEKPARLSRKLEGRIHIVIGDTQIKPGVPTRHLTWIGRYIVEKYSGRDVSVIHLGDHWDMPSLSMYDKGKKAMEGRRFVDDIEAGNKAFDELCAPIEAAKRWKPDLHFCLGNHEDRITRAVECDAQLEGALSLEMLNAKAHGWKVHEFCKPVEIDGVKYAHYFYNLNTSRPHGGDNLYTRLKNIGFSFTMGHQQGLKTAMREVGGTRHQGLVLGSTYLHDEEYIGPQGNSYWRGIAICHQVENGTYDPMFVSLDYLCRRYEKKTLAQFMSDSKDISTEEAA